MEKPYLTYNEPSGRFTLKEEKPILLDFYVSNCILSKDGYKVRMTVDNKARRLLTNWTPYYLYGLKKGSHTIKLELLNGDGRIVEGPFSTFEKSFTVE